MKIKVNENSVITNTSANSVDFGIGDPSMIIEILRSKLYNKPIQTLVQEYLCNARDAMREAGKGNESIAVTLPAHGVPFKVRDYGQGLSPERMRQVFTQYGKSTKRTDNSQTGGFGIGAKSAWAYTDNFSIVSYHDGIKYSYLAHIGSKSTGALDLLSQEPSSEPSGVEISIAVKDDDCRTFTMAVWRATCFWDVQPIVDGELFTGITHVFKSGNISIHTKKSMENIASSDIVMVVDGIPYAIDPSQAKALDNILQREYVACVYVNTGDVVVGANRESLTDNPVTQSGIDAACIAALRVVDNYVTDILSQATTLREFFDTYTNITTWYANAVDRHHNDVSGNYTLDYNGRLIGHTAMLSKYSMSDSYRSKTVKQSTINSGMHKQRYIYVNELTTQAKYKERIKNYLNTMPKNSGDDYYNRGTSVVVISHADIDNPSYKAFCASIGASPISEIYTHSKTRVKKTENIVTIYTYKPNRRKNTVESAYIDVSTVKSNYVYVIKEDDFEQQRRDNDSIFELLSELGYTPCFMTASEALKVTENNHFTNLSDILSNPLEYLNADTITALCDGMLCGVSNGYKSRYNWLFTQDAKFDTIQDVSFKQLCESIQAIQVKDLKCSHESVIGKALLAAMPLLNEQVTNILSFQTHIDKYPLISNIRLSYYDSDKGVLDEAIFYLNAKYKGKG